MIEHQVFMDVISALIVGIAASVAGGVVKTRLAGAMKISVPPYLAMPAPSRDKALTQRLDSAVAALKDAQDDAQELAADISKRRDEVERLEEERELLNLTRAELKAVRAALMQEGRRSFWLGVAVNFVFFCFCFGVGATLLIG